MGSSAAFECFRFGLNIWKVSSEVRLGYICGYGRDMGGICGSAIYVDTVNVKIIFQIPYDYRMKLQYEVCMGAV